MAKPVEWLGQFIEDEVRSVIEWKKHIQSNPQVKRDPDERFSDDGSNFRSGIVSSTLPNDANVQISKVLSIHDPVTVLVSDGFTRVKARLSMAAVATLEAESGEQIGMEMRGDVFSIRGATVISTPYGPSEGFVQLAIDGLDYLYHLRKDIGRPTTIEQRPRMKQLIEAITELRLQQYGSAHDKPSAHQNEPEPIPAAPRDDEREQESDYDTLGSQPLLLPKSSPPVSFQVQQSPSSQLALATQVPVRKKAKGPNLAKDGFEMEAGLNLDRPTGAGFVNASRRVPSHERDRPPAIAGNTAHLLSLLGKRKAEQQRQPPSPDPLQQPTSPPTANVHKSTPQPRRPEPMVKRTSATSSPIAQTHSQRPARSDTTPRNYRRRKIPRDQQNLLDRPTSWVPSLPGQRFPHPNVPIGLLKKWNAQVPPLKQSKKPSESQVLEPTSATVEADSPLEASPMEISDDSSSESSSEDEEIPASQWPPSPSQMRAKPSLPPDSSILGETRPSQPPRYPLPRPNSMFARYGRPSSLPQKPQRVFDGATDSDTPNSSPPQRQPDLPPDTPDETRMKHSHSQRPQRDPPDNSAKSTARPSPSQRKQQHAPPDRTFRSVVRGTQLSKKTDDELGMDVGVPRSLPADPALAHRQRRSEHFKAAQRRHWIKENYMPSSKPPPNFAKVFRSYKFAFPNDTIKPSDLADAIKYVYPDDNDNNNGDGTPPPWISEASQSPKAKENVASTFSQNRTSTADVEGVVEASATLPGQPGQQHQSLRPLPASEPPPSLGSGRSSNESPASIIRSRPVSVVSLPTNSTPRPAAAAPALATLPRPPPSQRKLPWPTKPTSPRTGARPLTAFTNSTPQNTTPSAKTHQPSPLAPAPPALGTDIPVQQSSASKPKTAATRKRPNDGVFAEFARAFKRVKPGGAFASAVGKGDHRGAEKRRAPPPHKLDVLAWEL